jgi:hypothetical protein
MISHPSPSRKELNTVPKGLALLFAVIATVLLGSISYFMAAGQAGMAIICSLIAVLFMGFGFAVKARMRKKKG